MATYVGRRRGGVSGEGGRRGGGPAWFLHGLLASSYSTITLLQLFRKIKNVLSLLLSFSFIVVRSIVNALI